MTGVIGWPWLKICLMGGGNAAMPKFEVVSEYQPSGDQPQAIAALAEGIENGLKEQVLLGVTGSG